jgi:dihydropteroate synthase
VSACEAYLIERLEQARDAGLADDQVILDAGLDLGKTTPQSLELLRASPRLASIGPCLLLSASNKGFLGDLFELKIDERREATMAALAVGVVGGCRILRVHDVRGACRISRTLEALL